MSIINLNNDLNKVRNWAIQWKMNFNADPSKQSQEVTFSKKLQKTNHKFSLFQSQLVQQVSSREHLEMYLDIKLTK